MSKLKFIIRKSRHSQRRIGSLSDVNRNVELRKKNFKKYQWICSSEWRLDEPSTTGNINLVVERDTHKRVYVSCANETFDGSTFSQGYMFLVEGPYFVGFQCEETLE